MDATRCTTSPVILEIIIAPHLHSVTMRTLSIGYRWGKCHKDINGKRKDVGFFTVVVPSSACRVLPTHHGVFRSIKEALRGTDIVGSHVRITVRRGDGSEDTVTLRRAPTSYVHLTQVYFELYDQLKGSVRDNR